MLCSKCKNIRFATVIGTCRDCGGTTACSAYRLCEICSGKKMQCQVCPASLSTKAKTPALPSNGKPCPSCATPMVSGPKYQDICTKCQPGYLAQCCGCSHALWECICVKPATWE